MHGVDKTAPSALSAEHYISTNWTPPPESNPCSSINMEAYAEPELGRVWSMNKAHIGRGISTVKASAALKEQAGILPFVKNLWKKSEMGKNEKRVWEKGSRKNQVQHEKTGSWLPSVNAWYEDRAVTDPLIVSYMGGGRESRNMRAECVPWSPLKWQNNKGS